MPFFSVVIPCYNGSKTLHETLNSVCAQTFKDFEVVVVNDGSTDSSLEILESYLGRLPLKIISQINAGLGGARNTGILNSNGEFVAFLDQDDIWYPEKLTRAFDLLKTFGSDLVCHWEDAQLNGISQGILKHGPYNNYYDILFKNNCLSPSAVCVRRKLLEEVGLFSIEEGGHLCEDWDLWLKLADRGATFLYQKEVLGICMLHGNNFSDTPGFSKKSEFVFESHVSRITSPSREILRKIKGARAMQAIYLAKSYLQASDFRNSAKSFFRAFMGGFTTPFFWQLFFMKVSSATRRRCSMLIRRWHLNRQPF